MNTESTPRAYVRMSGISEWEEVEPFQNAVRIVKIVQEEGIAPQLYFKYVKSKFSLLERMRMDNRMKRLEKAFNKAIANGQTALAEKFMLECVRETRESAMFAKGIRLFIEKDDLDKHKKNIRGGHISDTRLEKYTRIIPKDILKKKKSVESVFDGFIIYHYWDSGAEEKRAKDQKMSEEEKMGMRDPVLFGYINESNRLYFVAEWEDEYCDLSFDEMADVLGKSEDELSIPRTPILP